MAGAGSGEKCLKAMATFLCCLQALADDASANLEAMTAPLFLRFLNLLMNDAIFLLDEAIQVKGKGWRARERTQDGEQGWGGDPSSVWF